MFLTDVLRLFNMLSITWFHSFRVTLLNEFHKMSADLSSQLTDKVDSWDYFVYFKQGHTPPTKRTNPAGAGLSSILSVDKCRLPPPSPLFMQEKLPLRCYLVTGVWTKRDPVLDLVKPYRWDGSAVFECSTGPCTFPWVACCRSHPQHRRISYSCNIPWQNLCRWQKHKFIITTWFVLDV